MIGSDAFNYINVLQKAAEAAQYRGEILNNNIANVSTPGYKRKDVQFESYLIAELSGGDNLDSQVAGIDLSAIRGSTYVDHGSLSYRLDGNNVDIDTEEAEFAKNQTRYYALMDSMTQEFSRIKAVLSRN